MEDVSQNIFQGDFYDALDYAVRKTGLIQTKGTVKIFCVTGKNSFEKSGANDVLDDLENVEYEVFNDFSPNPKFDDVVLGVQSLKDFNTDIVLAIGGGSAMDIAKLIVGFADKDKSNFESYVMGQKSIDTVATPLWVAPTTSGSGAEATHFAVVYHNDKKYSVASDAILPSYVFLDSFLTHSTPYKVAVCSGIDAMCQAMESYWAVSATNESRNYATLAMQSVLENIIPALEENDTKSLRELQYASHLAGKAINITKTTAGHAFSYYLTSTHNVPHGHAVAIMLRYVFMYALKYGDDAVLKVCVDMADILSINTDELPQFLEEMMDEFNLQYTLDGLGITDKSEIKTLCESVNVERLSNSPVIIDLDKFQNLIGEHNND